MYELILVSVAFNESEYVYLSKDGIILYQYFIASFLPGIKFLHTWIEWGTVAVDCLALGSEIGPIDAESNAIKIWWTNITRCATKTIAAGQNREQYTMALRQHFTNSPTSLIQLPVMVVPSLKSLKKKSCFSTDCGVSAKMILHKLFQSAFQFNKDAFSLEGAV